MVILHSCHSILCSKLNLNMISFHNTVNTFAASSISTKQQYFPKVLSVLQMIFFSTGINTIFPLLKDLKRRFLEYIRGGVMPLIRTLAKIVHPSLVKILGKKTNSKHFGKYSCFQCTAPKFLGVKITF